MKRPEITALAVFAALLLGLTPLAAIATTQQQVNTRDDVIETQNTITQSVESIEDLPDGYSIRWSTIGEIEGNNGVGVLVADCLPGEIPLTPLYNLWENVGITQQLVIGVDDHLSLLLVVQNYGDDKQAISVGVACLDEDGDDDDDGDNDVTVDNSIEITNIVRNVVKNINKNITIIGNGTGSNGSIVIPPPNGGNNTDTDNNDTTTNPPPVTNNTEPEPPVNEEPPITNNTEPETITPPPTEPETPPTEPETPPTEPTEPETPPTEPEETPTEPTEPETPPTEPEETPTEPEEPEEQPTEPEEPEEPTESGE